MRTWLMRGIVGALAAGAIGFLFLPVLPVTPQTTGMHLDLPGAAAPLIPANCATWHELYPVFSTPHHQSGFEDNGDGVLSACDYICLDGLKYHIKWVGPTYFTSVAGQTGPIFEPVEQNPGPNPICEIWHEVYPEYCRQIHVDSWIDGNQNGILDACDEIDVEVPGAPPVIYHIDKVGVDIIVEGPVPAKQSTWGWIKGFFR